MGYVCSRHHRGHHQGHDKGTHSPERDGIHRLSDKGHPGSDGGVVIIPLRIKILGHSMDRRVHV
jgi:hypothetical protein